MLDIWYLIQITKTFLYIPADTFLKNFMFGSYVLLQYKQNHPVVDLPAQAVIFWEEPA